MPKIFCSNRLFFFCSSLLLLSSGSLLAQQSGWSGYRSPVTTKPIPALAPTNEPQGNGETDFILLKTGYLAEGIATNEGKYYTIKTEFGGMQIPTVNVEYIGRSRQDVYRFRRNLVDGNNCQDVMKFAEWCLNNGLPKESLEEYRRAQLVAPNATLGGFIQQRIESLQRQIDSGAAALQNPFVAPDAGLSGAGASDLNDDINPIVSGMPKSIVDSFSRKVQPILSSRCAAADCHGSASENGFKVSIPRHPNGSTTYRNLQASLRWVDPNNPSASPLLSAMVSHHGGVKPAFNVESNQYNSTIQWIQTTIKDLPSEYASQLYSAKQPKKLEASIAPAPKTGDVPQTFFAEKDKVPVNFVPTRLNVPGPMQPPSGPAPSQPTSDPLDPTLFNARFHGTVDPPSKSFR